MGTADNSRVRPDVPGPRVDRPAGGSAIREAESVIWWAPSRRLGVVLHDGRAVTGDLPELLDAIREAEIATAPRWIWWAARDVVPVLLASGIEVSRCWDLAEVHRLLAGGYDAEPAEAWALARGLDPARAPRPVGDDLFDFAVAGGFGGDVASGEESGPIRRDGYLRPDAVTGAWQVGSDTGDRHGHHDPRDDVTRGRLVAWADTLSDLATAQRTALSAISPRAVTTAWSESAAALLAVELEQVGLPVDRPALEGIIHDLTGPRAGTPEDQAAIRATRDEAVLRHVRPVSGPADLRNPASVRALLAGVGIDVPDTRKWTLQPYVGVHPVVEALLQWRARERIATTYGYEWLDTQVGPDGRLRGAWTACDGAAGRMTAQSGLHNLPAALRAGVAAEPGHVFVRADLGQIEPRVLAAVARDADFAAATSADDLYAPVAAALGVERPQAKVAVLAAMYGQTSGAAGDALRRLERAYPTAIAYLDAAYAAGMRGESVRTYGGRLVRVGLVPAGVPQWERAQAGRARYARNAVIQGAAAELFKAWAATVRAGIRPLGGRIVLCLHDELLIHVPAENAAETVSVVDEGLSSSSRRYTGTQRVRFVSDTSVIARWSEAKG